ncbi:binding-protein-dependent transport systems inner membrane component [Thermoproteus uzoniensis 768-20]|uniref:Binding-protein-dependent transport systems inner membrane component n=1 Tax=Thermoproteus uzoniensis (strain 768-20) TaxID=999630 RepID=F2L1H3_THEU7|nr:ABC transporter permease [Thermoproteus uzoniensis]AEA11643.1 binding-protein-dependent transport systems inner membrane component [Thermoproteus uzoniensis 768-20]
MKTASIKRNFSLIWRSLPARFGLLVIIAYVVMAAVGPVLLPYKPVSFPNQSEILLPPQPWPPSMWLGTDMTGEGILVDIVNGAPFVLEVSFLAGLFTTLIGLAVGVVAGYLGRYVDAVLMWITDTLLTIPSLLLVVIIATMIKTENPLVLAGILSITGWTGLARAVRSQVLAIKNLPYIEAARVLGLGTGYILFREILPPLMPYIWINLILNVEGAIYAAVGLYYLGLLPFKNYDWGAMINFALQLGAVYGTNAVWYLLFPVLFISLYMVALMELAYGIEEIVNPRLRR